jgi:hypothetical protein
MSDNIIILNEIVPPEYLHLHNDFNKVFNFVKIKYIRNVLRWNYNFKNPNLIMTKFNYSYANNNDCIPHFKKMQSQTRIYELKFKNNNDEWNYKMQNQYIHFLTVSMKEIIKNLIYPISDVQPEIREIINNYKKNEYLYGPQFEDSDDDISDDTDTENDNEYNESIQIINSANIHSNSTHIMCNTANIST